MSDFHCAPCGKFPIIDEILTYRTGVDTMKSRSLTVNLPLLVTEKTDKQTSDRLNEVLDEWNRELWRAQPWYVRYRGWIWTAVVVYGVAFWFGLTVLAIRWVE